MPEAASVSAVVASLFVAGLALPGVLLARTSVGGPDGFGYTWTDSNETGPGAPQFLFIDMSASGTPRLLGSDGGEHLFVGPPASSTPLIVDDDGEATVAMSFTMPIYGVYSSLLRVGNNGALHFATATGEVAAANSCPLPSGSLPARPHLWVHWDDLAADNGIVMAGDFAVCPHPLEATPCFVVQWHQRNHQFSAPNQSVTFEVVLFPSGSILCQYLDVDFGSGTLDAGASATVGIEGFAAPNHVLEYQCNGGGLAANLAILWRALPIPVELEYFSIE